MQSYKIRRNNEGNMIYFDAMELVNLCLEVNILQGKKNEWIAVYHKESETNPKEYPEGWYKDDYEETIQSIMRDDEAVKILLTELDNKGLEFKPSLDIELLNTL